uniref:Uncharacterized protein n=1 Tax=Romanomermis culicivorax TaxID=13658 RepID=A0A915JSY3_ROMCU
MQPLTSELWLQMEPYVHVWFNEWAPRSALTGTNLLIVRLLHKVAHIPMTLHQIWSNYQCGEYFIPNYLRSVAQQGKYPYLLDAMEQIQNLQQSKYERIENAIKDMDQLILPEISTKYVESTFGLSDPGPHRTLCTNNPSRKNQDPILKKGKLGGTSKDENFHLKTDQSKASIGLLCLYRRLKQEKIVVDKNKLVKKKCV